MGGGASREFCRAALASAGPGARPRLAVVDFRASRSFQAWAGKLQKACAGILSLTSCAAWTSFGLSLLSRSSRPAARLCAPRVWAGDLYRAADPRRGFSASIEARGPAHHQGSLSPALTEYYLTRPAPTAHNAFPAGLRLVEWDGGPIVRTSHERYPAPTWSFWLPASTAMRPSARLRILPPQDRRHGARRDPAPGELGRITKWPDSWRAGGTGIRRYGSKGPISQRLLAWTRPCRRDHPSLYQSQDRALGSFFRPCQKACVVARRASP